MADLSRSRLAAVMAAALCLCACGGGGSSDQAPAGAASNPTPAQAASAPASAASTATAAEAIAEMERSGTLPVLDRSATLVGIDANGDGIRDDLERHIAALPDADPQRAALRQLVQAQSALLAADAGQVEARAAKVVAAVACVWISYPADQAAQRVQEMRRLLLNTRERFAAWLRSNEALQAGAAALDLPEGKPCQ